MLSEDVNAAAEADADTTASAAPVCPLNSLITEHAMLCETLIGHGLEFSELLFSALGQEH